MNSLKKLWRWLKFHFIYKRKFSKTLGIPTLCENLNHPFHESKFEQTTCGLLSKFFKDSEVLVPSNHNYSIKFDFIIKNNAIIEPHGIWSNNPGDSSYFAYYEERKKHAIKQKELNDLPIVVLTNSSDLSLLRSRLQNSNNYKKTFFEISKDLLEKYKTDVPDIQQEFSVHLIHLSIVTILGLSILLNIILLSIIIL